MADNPLPTELRHFIADHIQSVEHLEILCLLSENPGQDWSVADVYRHIQSSEKSVSEGLRHFAAHGLAVDSHGTYRFLPRNRDLEVLAQQLICMYRERRVSVIETIYKKPSESVQHFADAFRLRKEK